MVEKKENSFIYSKFDGREEETRLPLAPKSYSKRNDKPKKYPNRLQNRQQCNPQTHLNPQKAVKTKYRRGGKSHYPTRKVLTTLDTKPLHHLSCSLNSFPNISKK